MKIVYFIPSLHLTGGMESVLSTKVNYLAENSEHKIYIVTTAQDGSEPYFKIHDSVTVINLGVRFYEGDSLVEKIVKYPKAIKVYKKCLLAKLNDINPDLLITLFGREIDFIQELTKKYKVIGELHFSHNYRSYIYQSIHKSSFAKVVSHIRERQLLNKIKKLERLIVLTHKDKKAWLADGVKQVEVIPNPSSLPVAVEPVGARPRVIAGIGRFVEQKNFMALVEVWHEISASCPDWALHLYGDGPLKHTLEQYIKDNNVQRVRIHPFVKGIAQVLDAVSVVAMTSKFEGLPMILIEAQSRGVPCIAYDCPQGPAEIIIQGHTGVLVKDQDKKAYIQQLHRMLSDEQVLNNYRHNSLAAARRFTIQDIMQKWESLFRRVNDEPG